MQTESVERRLAAILSADVVGYSRLMGADEEGTLASLKAHREQLIDPKIAAHRGRIVKTTGDGILAEFASVVEAVRCAVEVQQGMTERNAEAPEDKRIRFRIGINLGDIIMDGTDILGDGVNVASRLEGLAHPGGICISGAARDQVQDKLRLTFEDMGEQHVKNIARPVRVYRIEPEAEPAAAPAPTLKPDRHRLLAAGAGLALLLAVVAIAAWMVLLRPPAPRVEPASMARMAFPLPDKPSIAVLPFANLSPDPKQDYFSDGITEDIITALARFPQMFVISRNTSFTYKGKPVKVQQVAEELGVRYVLEGSVRRSGDRVRITTQLIDATTGHHLWAERFDRAIEDVFAVQDEVTQKIVAALAEEVSTAEVKRVMRKDTENLEAYDYVLRGQQLRRAFNRETNAQARELFEKAIALDPSYARAYAHLAWTHLNDWQLGWSESRPQSLERAFELARKAAGLNESDPVAHMALGEVYLWRKQYQEALAHSQRAVALNPNNADGYAALADKLAWSGKPEDAIRNMEKSMRLNPKHRYMNYWYLGHAQFLAQRYDEAIAALRKVVARDKTFWPAHVYLAASLSRLNRIEEARAEAAEALKLNPALDTGRVPEQIPYQNPADLAHLLDALGKAGLSPR
ncbi:MAG: adenylate/guanylate cyclase domain-containing protein [Kiloniellales bacterium]